MKILSHAVLIALILILANPLAALALKPEELSPPRISSPVYQGAEVVEVSGFIPKADIKIYENGVEVGGRRCWFSKCTFEVSKLTFGREIKATQTVDGVTSFKTRAEHTVTVAKIPAHFRDPMYSNERIIPPAVGPDLYECQRIVPVKNVIEGAFVQVYKLSDQVNPIGREKTPWDYARIGTQELLEKQKIVASQTLLFPKPSDLSPDVSVKAKPEKKDIKKPVVKTSSLVVGSDAVQVDDLFIGATVEIYYQQGSTRESIGRNLARWSSTIFQVKPLKAAWAGCADCIKADQSLCEMTVSGAGMPVRNSLDPLVILRPVCAGSSAFTVCKTVLNAPLTIFVKGNPDQQIGQLGADDECTTVTLGGTTQLKNGDEIYAIQTVGKLKSESNRVKVVTNSPPHFEIENGRFCPSCPGEDYGMLFDRNSLTSTKGPVFKAAMCGAEAAKVEIRGPNDALVETITLEQLEDKKGYFTGSWDWAKIGWKASQDIPPGKYRASFKIWPAGANTEQDQFFYLSTQGCDEIEVLCAHNKYRAEIHLENPGVPALEPLVWSQELADHAKAWAEHLAANNLWEHDENRPNDEGENLHSGSSTFAAAIDSWGDEKKCFKNGIVKDIYNGQCDSDPGCMKYKDWRCSGHYSQMVWRQTKEVGCGRSKSITACRYRPPGNYNGQKAY